MPLYHTISLYTPSLQTTALHLYHTTSLRPPSPTTTLPHSTLYYHTLHTISLQTTSLHTPILPHHLTTNPPSSHYLTTPPSLPPYSSGGLGPGSSGGNNSDGGTSPSTAPRRTLTPKGELVNALRMLDDEYRSLDESGRTFYSTLILSKTAPYNTSHHGLMMMNIGH